MSLKALAESLGLSKTTVSRALAGYEDVSADTRARVKAAAEAVGYSPNPTALRLSKGTSDTVAIVVPSTASRRYEPLFVDVAAAMGARLGEEGRDLILTAARPDEDELQVYRRLVDGKRADAVVLVRTRVEDTRVDFLRARGFPFVCFGRTGSTRDIAFVDGDGLGAFDAATTRLIELGHRRHAFLGGPRNSFSSDNRRAGYRRALDRAGLPMGPLLEDRSEEAAGAEMARAALADGATALTCATDRIAIGALGAVRQSGLVPGRDVSIVGHDNLPVTQFTDPQLTTMELSVSDVGVRLADTALALCAGANPADHQTVLPVTIHWRGSVGPPPNA